jgi:hypothetical protein
MSRLGEHPNFAKKVFSGTHQRPIYHTSGQRDLFITQAGNATYLSHKRATRPIYHTSGQDARTTINWRIYLLKIFYLIGIFLENLFIKNLLFNWHFFSK